MPAVRMSSVALAYGTASMPASRLGNAPSSDYQSRILEMESRQSGTLTVSGSSFIGGLAPTDKDHKLAGFSLKKLCVWSSYRPLSSY